jgi:arginase
MQEDAIAIGIAKLPYTGHPVNEISAGPEALEKGGTMQVLEGKGCKVAFSQAAALTPEEEKQYGAWNKLSLASRHLANIVKEQNLRGLFTIGLLANCNGLMGMLAGLQRSGKDWRPLKVGLIWIDAHSDINTPETTLSGRLGGMPVAVSTGMCLHRLRIKCGLEPALPTRYVTMVGVRDTDPLEQQIIDRSQIENITVDQIKRLSPAIDLEMERLTTLTDVIYIHVDMDILDPKEVPGHEFKVPDGPTSIEMGEALEVIFEYPNVAAFGIASYPVNKDPDKRSLRAALNLMEGVAKGLKNRQTTSI